ncbi:DUF2726 domain-containing protein [Neisseriaceae bacterium TC5R-5]|nr:DUF2726 domain-containing protein [Neisseriaceae bacterium TC5R-5]
MNILLDLGAVILVTAIMLLASTRQSKKKRLTILAEADKNSPSSPATTQTMIPSSAMGSYGQATLKTKRDTILSPGEIECFRRLSRSLSPDFYVFPQVAFRRILEAHGGTPEQNLWLFRTISQQVADFIVCKQDMTMVAVIELDNRSPAEQKDTDKVHDKIIRQVGLLPFRLPYVAQQDKIDAYAAVLRRMYCPAAKESATQPQITLATNTA